MPRKRSVEKDVGSVNEDLSGLVKPDALWPRDQDDHLVADATRHARADAAVQKVRGAKPLGEQAFTDPGDAAAAPVAEKKCCWTASEEWPSAITDYFTGIDLLHTMWTRDRAYSIQELTQMAQARFELSRKRRMPGHYYRVLRKIEQAWTRREVGRLPPPRDSRGPTGVAGAPSQWWRQA